jgi:ubiquinone biosynthesis protein COQ9
MWRIAGDTATDFNHYSKRAILASIYAATLLVWLDDDSEGQAETTAFLDRRLAGVARFEKAKASWTGSSERRPSLARFVGRLRYPPA